VSKYFALFYSCQGLHGTKRNWLYVYRTSYSKTFNDAGSELTSVTDAKQSSRSNSSNQNSTQTKLPSELFAT